jgi:hypothetical protein
MVRFGFARFLRVLARLWRGSVDWVMAWSVKRLNGLGGRLVPFAGERLLSFRRFDTNRSKAGVFGPVLALQHWNTPVFDSWVGSFHSVLLVAN